MNGKWQVAGGGWQVASGRDSDGESGMIRIAPKGRQSIARGVSKREPSSTHDTHNRKSPGGATHGAEDRRVPQSFVCLNCHMVFSTKNRLPSIDRELAPRLYAYVGGIADSLGAKLVASAGTADHVHLVVSLGKATSTADAVRAIKSNSSGWIHKTFPKMRDFAWQTGYGAFAVSYSNLDQVKRYVANQEEHHRVRTFREEFLALLKRHNIPYDERYMWD